MLLALLFACAPPLETPAPADLPVHTLVYGGDVTLGRGLNEALWGLEEGTEVLSGLAWLRDADYALVNAEGVIAAGGLIHDKGESRPHLFRAHPRAVEVLRRAGVDAVTVGNNHAGDYGPRAFSEMIDHLDVAGLGYTGGGRDLADARTPLYVTMGDVVVALVGVDLTMASDYAAAEDRAGTLALVRPPAGDSQRTITEELRKIAQNARAHAHVVLLTPHWGDNFKGEPTEATRALARDLLAAGYDGILGHSAHWLQGVEVFDGKPVIYDAGNLVVDYGGGDPAHQAFLWRLSVTQAGVSAIEGQPLRLMRNRTAVATGAEAARTLGLLQSRSEALGASVQLKDGIARLNLDPGGVIAPRGGPPPERVKTTTVAAAPHERLLHALPASATPLAVRYGDGLSLLGYELITPTLKVPKAGQVIATYWRAEQPILDFQVVLRASGTPERGGAATEELRHMPGDWLLPASQWPTDMVVRDLSLMRLLFAPEGEVRFSIGVWRDGMVAPVESGVSLDGPWVPIGAATYDASAPRVFTPLEAWYRREGLLAPEETLRPSRQ